MNIEQIKSSIIWEKVKFERTKEDLNNRQTFALEVSIAKDENYLAVFDFVKSTVNNELGIDCDDLIEKRRSLINKINDLERQKAQYEEELANAKQFHRKASAFFEKLGLDPAEIFRTPVPTDAIPF